jgi:hypothetical protein
VNVKKHCFLFVIHAYTDMASEGRHRKAYTRLFYEFYSELVSDIKRAIPDFTDEEGNVDPMVVLRGAYMSIAVLFILAGIYYCYKEYEWMYLQKRSLILKKSKST